MMKNLLLVSICICFSSCGFVRNDQVIGKYHILSVDDYNKPCLSYELEKEYQICIVPSKVVAYFKNKQFIFIKQIPYGNKDTLDVNYYIVPILKDTPDVFPENLIIGPLKEQKFNEEISNMNLKKLKFKKID